LSDDPNIGIIELLAEALGDMRSQFVFVGGCAVGLLLTDRAGQAVRATNDVDVITEVSGLAKYYALAETLKTRGFAESKEEGPTCRWLYKGVKVDVMPSDGSLLGFENAWYGDAVRSATDFKLPSGTNIRLISAPHLLATKIEAFHDRGNNDFQSSPDLEDIISVVDRRPELIAEVQAQDEALRAFIADEIEALLSLPGFVSAVPFHLRPDEAERADVVITRLRELAGL
jgi:predicted nucleotidyltransferase